MIRIKQTACKITEKTLRKNLAVKANNLSKNKAKMLKRNLKKHKIKSEDMCKLFIYCDLLISVIVKALWEIHCYQKSTELLIFKLSFQHVIREICAEMLREDLKWDASTITCLQEITKIFMINEFESKLNYFLLIIRLIINICSVQFMHDSWSLNYVTDLKHASSENVVWMNEFICISSEIKEERAYV